MIKNDKELQVTLQRIRTFQDQVAHLRKTERDSENYHLTAGGFLAELDRMQLEVRDYLWLHPSEVALG